MGIGSLREISLAVASGFDIFDCVLPTRLEDMELHFLMMKG